MTRRTAALLLTLIVALGCTRPNVDGRTVIIISIDTLRADALSTYGSARPTPALDALGREGVVFEAAYAPSPWTVPSHAALFSSLDPEALGAHGRASIPDGAPLLAERFRDAGFTTTAVVNTIYVDTHYGFDRGFDEFEHPHARKDGDRSLDLAFDSLASHPDRDVFAFVHLFDVHGPYDAPEPFKNRYVGEARAAPDAIAFIREIGYHRHVRELQDATGPEWVRARYDAGVARIDALLGEFFERLKEIGRYDDAWIVVTSDHGEAFFERDVWIGHGLFLYDTELRVPLIVKPPAGFGNTGQRVTNPVSLVDIAPTLLDALDLPALPATTGRSLLPAIATSDSLPPAEIHAHSLHLDARAVRYGRWKLIAPAGRERARVIGQALRAEGAAAAVLRRRIDLGLQLYDLEADPGESANVAAAHPEVVAGLRRRIRLHRTATHAQRDALGERTDVALGPDERERLRQLGYAE